MRPIKVADPSRQHSIIEKIERGLLTALAHANRQATNTDIVFWIEGDDGEPIGGLIASTAYGWLHVELLWIDIAFRGQGLGRSLMSAAESHARANQCHSVWLDTSMSEARAFYARLGFSTCGELRNGDGRFPEEHVRWFLSKRLDASG